jgi:dihydrofolate reductase
MHHPEIWLIAAMNLNRVIGKDNQLPWHSKSDLKYFKQVTAGHSIVMGRRTFESLEGKPLPLRRNIILSKSFPAIARPDVHVLTNMEDAVQLCSAEQKIFIIGGAQIYKHALNHLPVAGVLLTLVHNNIDGDTFFPEFESKFKLIKTVAGMENGTLIEWQTWVTP